MKETLRVAALADTHYSKTSQGSLLPLFMQVSESADVLFGRLEKERYTPPAHVKLCQGTLLSRAHYLVDVEEWGYKDTRLMPRGNMTPEEIEIWTAAIDEKGEG